MKRIFGSLIVVILLLIGCSSDDKGDAVIKEATLSEFEKNLISLYGGASFIHDVKIHNDQVNEIYLYIDLYKNGQHVGTVSEMGLDVSEEELRTVFLNLPDKESERQWISAVMMESGYASSNASNKLDETEYQSSAWGGVSGEITLNIGEEHPIASLVYSNRDSIGMIDDLSIKDALNEQTKYEEVYIFSVELR